MNDISVASRLASVTWTLTLSLASPAALAAAPEMGRLVHIGPMGPVAHPPDVHPMFTHWAYVPGGPLVCRFQGRPDTRYQVLIGFTEDFWDRAGQRMIDVEVAGKIAGTVDTFSGAKGKPHARLFPGTTDARGELLVRLLPSPTSPDKNPAVCGLMLFAAGVHVDVDSVIGNRGPRPLAEVLVTQVEPQYYQDRGKYFSKKAYRPEPLPRYPDARNKLPSPIFDENPSYVAVYWKAWELAFRNYYEPAPGSGFVSQFSDAAFSQNIYQWDTCFITMFCNYGHPYVPGIRSLDNFYCKQFEDGEICREIERTSGREYHEWINREGGGLLSRWGVLIDGGPRPFTVTYVDREPPQPPPQLTLDGLNHPILAWAELESFRITGDRGRLALVYQPLLKYYRALQKYIRQGNGLYMTDWASMDNSPRNRWLDRGGAGVDTSAQMVLFARNLADIAELLRKKEDAAGLRREAEELSGLINAKMWDSDRKFYFDVAVDGKRSPVRTVAAFWTLLAGVAGPPQVEALVAELHNSKTFARKHRVPTLSADEASYDPTGGYWQGAVWSPTNTMVVRGLENRGHRDLAREIALEHLSVIGDVFKETGTVWENYAPDAARPGTPAKRDFVGWSGLGPILYLIEYAIGIRVDAASNTITWTIRSPRRVGIEQLWFGGKTVSLVCDEPDAAGRRTVRARSDATFRLMVIYSGSAREVEVSQGQALEMRVGPAAP